MSYRPVIPATLEAVPGELQGQGNPWLHSHFEVNRECIQKFPFEKRRGKQETYMIRIPLSIFPKNKFSDSISILEKPMEKRRENSEVFVEVRARGK